MPADASSAPSPAPSASAALAAEPPAPIEPYADEPVDRVTLHAAQWEMIHAQYPTAKDVSALLPGWVTPGANLGALGLVNGGNFLEKPGPNYVLVREGTEGPVPVPHALSGRTPYPIATLATFDAAKPGVRASRVAVSRVGSELWLGGTSVAYLAQGGLPGGGHETVLEGPGSVRFVAIYDGTMDPNMVDLQLLAMVEGHLAPVLRLTVLGAPLGPWPCNGDPSSEGPRECSWFAPLPQVLQADAAGVELLTWSYDAKSTTQCEAPFRCPLAQQTYVYSASSRRFEPRGQKVEAMKPLVRVHQPPLAQQPSPWSGRYAFSWHGGAGPAGGIVAVRTYDAVVTGGEGNLQVTLTEQGTQTMGAAYDAHGVPGPDGLAITLDHCRSDDEHACTATKAGDVVATLTKQNRLRFGTIMAPDGALKELAGKKLP